MGENPPKMTKLCQFSSQMEAEDQLVSAIVLSDIIYSVAIASCFFIHYKMQVTNR